MKKFINGLFVVTILMVTVLAQGCFHAATSTSASPYGQARMRQVCVAGNCRMVSDQEAVATVDTRGYEACVAAFTADNEAGLAICEEGVTGCRYSQTQIMDACTLRAGALNGTPFGTMGFGQFMPLYMSGQFAGMNPGMTAGYDAQRQAVLYGPQVPNLPPASQTPASMTDAQLEAEARRIDDEAVRRAEARAAARQ